MIELITPYLPALAGGLLIGAAATLLFLGIGRIAGISNILYGSLRHPRTQSWGLAFLLGLPLGTLLTHAAADVPQPALPEASIPLLVASGLLVGFGSRLGSGCTSGHGICGIARLSPRSLLATAVFMATAMITVYVRLHRA